MPKLKWSFTDLSNLYPELHQFVRVPPKIQQNI